MARPLAVLNEVLYPGAAWDPGVRASLGWSSACDGWDLLLEWTYYKNDRKKTFSTPPITGIGNGDAGDLILFNYWTDNARNVDSIQSKWEFKFNQLDFVLGRRSWVSPCFTVRPFAGLRFLWTDVEFESTSTKNTIPNLSNSSE